jgi:hypothetical protein
MGAILFSSLLIVSCDSDDGGGDGPSDPEPQGTFTGTLIDASNGEESEWTATVLSAEYDTFETELTITAANAAGAEINISLSGTIDIDNPTSKPFSGSSNNISTYTFPGGDEFTTVRNDFGESSGTILYTNYNDTTNLLEGMGSLRWFATTDTTDDDLRYVLTDITFELYPERVGPSVGSASISATIDGEAFTPEFTSSSTLGGGILISGSSSSGESISMTIQSGATTGEESLGLSPNVQISYSDGSSSYSATSGTANITSLDLDEGTAEGTFNFTGTAIGGSATVDVTNGTFSAE